MKKIIALILSLALSATLFATLASCGKDKKSDTTVKYEWNTTEDSDGVVTLTSYSVSDAAKDLISDKKYTELAEGFTKNAPDGKKYDKDTVKTVTIPENVNKIAAGAIDSLSALSPTSPRLRKSLFPLRATSSVRRAKRSFSVIFSERLPLPPSLPARRLITTATVTTLQLITSPRL